MRSMKLLVVAVVILSVYLEIEASQQMAGVPTTSGSCASIGYSNHCCPPSSNRTLCKATDGTCQCDTACYMYRDCCNDRACVEAPTTCVATGITQCCTNSGYNCDVVHPLGNSNFRCSCDAACHRRSDCCPDINTIGCPLPRTCYDAGKDPGCCMWTSGSQCYVGGGDCYCDSYCRVFGDCCSDVLNQCTAHTFSTLRNHYNAAAQQDLLALHIQQYHLQRPPIFPEHDHHRMALAARTERMRTNAREFRGRARARIAARPPAQYNYDYHY